MGATKNDSAPVTVQPDNDKTEKLQPHTADATGAVYDH